MRVTDLDKFSLEQVWRPYQTLCGHGADPLRIAPCSLDETAQWLAANTEWSRHVIKRLSMIGVTFPDYIKHPLVDVINRRVPELTSTTPLPPEQEA